MSMKTTRWFRIEAKVQGIKEPFVDWYEASDEAEAVGLWDEDAHRYQLPMDKTGITVREATEKEASLFV